MRLLAMLVACGTPSPVVDHACEDTCRRILDCYVDRALDDLDPAGVQCAWSAGAMRDCIAACTDVTDPCLECAASTAPQCEPGGPSWESCAACGIPAFGRLVDRHSDVECWPGGPQPSSCTFGPRYPSLLLSTEDGRALAYSGTATVAATDPLELALPVGRVTAQLRDMILPPLTIGSTVTVEVEARDCPFVCAASMSIRDGSSVFAAWTHRPPPSLPELSLSYALAPCSSITGRGCGHTIAMDLTAELAGHTDRVPAGYERRIGPFIVVNGDSQQRFLVQCTDTLEVAMVGFVFRE